MSFWDELAQAEAKAAVVVYSGPTHCTVCGELKLDTLLGICDACFDAWEGRT